MRVTAFTRYARAAASTRQRVLQYLPALAAAGIEVDYRPLLPDAYIESLATGRRFSKAAIARSYARRIGQLLAAGDSDVLWIYGELFPFLPAAFERLAFRSGKPVVYDFDDAFFLQYESSQLLRGKLDGLIAGAAACCCGNELLRTYAARLNDHALVLPTVVDTDAYVPAPKRPAGPVTIGWIGSPSTWQYVQPLLPVLGELCDGASARMLAVGAGVAAGKDLFPSLELRAWSEEGEIASVQDMDIGIMPIPNDAWARGKSGYKLVQYMACGLPVVASPVGVNAQMVSAGENGFLATSLDEWREALARLIGDSSLRAAMGRAGRERAVQSYSLHSQAPRLVSLFEAVAAGRPRVTTGDGS